MTPLPPTRPAATSTAAIKKDIQKLQRAVVDGLEDVKAQAIVVFDTELLSPLFERVIIASGTSNRQTKALAASVLDAVREAGFDKPRVEGEDNGEWIIVDCGQAVVHIMQPAIRQYYNLEELWGDKPVRLKLGASKPRVASPVVAPSARPTSDKPPSLKRSSAAQKAHAQAFPSKAAVRKATAGAKPAGKAVGKSTKSASGAGATRAKVKTLVVNAPPKVPAKRSLGASTGKPRKS